MNSILLTSNINKYAGKNFTPRNIKYQPQTTANKMAKKFNPEQIRYVKTNIDSEQLSSMLKAPRMIFNNFGKVLFNNK